MKSLVSSILFILLVLVQIFPSKCSSDSIVLEKQNFEELVLQNPNAVLVKFFTYWCKHCKTLAPEWEKAATLMKHVIPFGQVNCDEQRDLCGMWGIAGYPMIKLFPANQSPHPWGNGAPFKMPIDYNDQRTAESLVSFALQYLPSVIEEVIEDKGTFFESESVPKVLFFNNQTDIPAFLKGIAVQFQGKVRFGEIKCPCFKLANLFRVVSWTAVVYVQPGGNHFSLFEGPLTPETLLQFLKSPPLSTPFNQEPSLEPTPEPSLEPTPKPSLEPAPLFSWVQRNSTDRKTWRRRQRELRKRGKALDTEVEEEVM